MERRLAVCLILSISLVFSIAGAESGVIVNASLTSITAPPPRTDNFSVRIGIRTRTIFGQPAELPIYLDSSSRGLSGYEFLIAFQEPELYLLGVTIGDSDAIPSTCGWEYFTYRKEQVRLDSADTISAVRVTAMADQSRSQKSGNCGIPVQYPAKLATITLLVQNNRNLECMFLPVRFLWASCEDNALTRVHPKTRYISQQVADFEGTSIPVGESFPSFGGAALDCDSNYSKQEKSERAVMFRDGGVEVICIDSIDSRGDINLNGIAYEVADLIMFRNYFLYGIPAFVGHFEGSQAASDVNGDGLTLTVADLVVIRNIVLGAPWNRQGPRTSPNQTHAHYDVSSGVLTLETPDTLGAIHLVFAGQASEVTIGGVFQDRLDFHYDEQSGVTRVIACDVNSVDSITGGVQLTVTPPLPIVSIECATFNGKRVTTVIDSPTGVDDGENGQVPSEFALYQNYPNPFNATTQISFDMPRAGVAAIEVVNSLGQVVRSWEKRYDIGMHVIEWNGLDDRGQPVASGVYYYRVTGDSVSQVRKMVLLK